MKAALLIILLLASICLCAQSAPLVTNVNALQRLDGSMIVDIHYDLYDAEGDACLVTIRVSTNNGASYDHLPSFGNLSGSVGYGQTTGQNKVIHWDTSNESFRLEGTNYRIRVIAEDGTNGSTIPPNFVYVAGGTCYNGVGNITLSSFYIDRYEVTQGSWVSVTGKNPSWGVGVGPNYPVYRVSWYDCLVYCNMRSMQEGLTPCYYYLDYGANPANWPPGWNDDIYDHMNIVCNWTANGYRLPTVAEWTFAAKGGTQSLGFPYSGSGVIDQVAWYALNSGGETHYVGYKAANELGIHDMTGNVWEWCWDIHAALPSTPQTDPHGPVSGTCRVTRGGSFSTAIEYCPIYFHNNGGYPYRTYSNTGLRLVRNDPANLQP